MMFSQPEILYVFDVWNQSGNHSERHTHDFFEISFLLEGEAQYWFQDQWQTIRGGDVLLFNPKIVHAEQQQATTYSHQLHIGIQQFQLPDLPPNVFPTDTPHVLLRENQLQIFNKAWLLMKEFNDQPTGFKSMGQALVTELLIFLLRSIQANQQLEEAQQPLLKNERLARVVTSVQSYIEHNFEKDISLESLANAHFVSPTYLSKSFKEQLGISPITYLIQVRLTHAFHLLKEQSGSVKDIAQAVGYDDAYHFSKSFKKTYGIAPSKVKKDARERTRGRDKSV